MHVYLLYNYIIFTCYVWLCHLLQWMVAPYHILKGWFTSIVFMQSHLIQQPVLLQSFVNLDDRVHQNGGPWTVLYNIIQAAALACDVSNDCWKAFIMKGQGATLALMLAMGHQQWCIHKVRIPPSSSQHNYNKTLVWQKAISLSCWYSPCIIINYMCIIGSIPMCGRIKESHWVITKISS